MIRCNFLGSRSPLLRRWHLLRCPECRSARAADAGIQRGLERLRVEPGPANGLARTLAAVGVTRAAKPRRRPRWQTAMRPYSTAGTLTTLAAVGAAGWLTYIDMNVKVAIPTPVMPTPNAYDFLLKAADAIPVVDRSPGLANPPMPAEHNRIDTALTNKQEYRLVRKKDATPLEKDSHADYVSVPVDTDSKYTNAAERAIHHVYTLEEKKKLVREYGPALTLLRKGFACSYQAPPIRSSSTLLSYLNDARYFARVLSLDAQAKAETGDYRGAADSSLDAMQLGAMICQRSVLMASQVGIACDAIGHKLLWEQVDHLTASQARAAIRRLEAIDQMETPFAATLQEEKWMCLATLQELLHARNWRTQFSNGTLSEMNGTVSEFPSGTAGLQKIATNYLTLLPYSKRRIVDDFTQLIDHQIMEARKPYTAQQMRHDLADAPAPKDPVVAMYFPFVSQYRFRRVAGVETQHALLRTALAIRAYQQEHHTYPKAFQEKLAQECISDPTGKDHAYPEHLENLVPDYLPAVPTDPFTDGTPLHYRLDISRWEPLSYRLYSVGPDGKDDYGTPIMSKYPSNLTPYRVDPTSEGDVVAGINTN